MKPENDYPPLQLEYFFSIPVETVFDAWLIPKIAEKWFFKSETNQLQFTSDPQKGGKFQMRELSDGEIIDHWGEYLEINKPNKLMFTLEVPKHFKGISTVTIEIEKNDMGCVLKLTQSGIDTSKTKSSWEDMLKNLKKLLEDNFNISGFNLN